MTLRYHTLLYKITTLIRIPPIQFYTLSRRFYPGNVPGGFPSIRNLVRFRQVLDITTLDKAPITKFHSLVPYSPTISEIYNKYRYYSHPLLIAQLHQFYQTTHRDKKALLNLIQSFITSEVQAVINYTQQCQHQITSKELLDYIEDLNKKNLSSDINILTSYITQLKSSSDMSPLNKDDERLLEKLQLMLTAKKVKMLEILSSTMHSLVISDVAKMGLKEFLSIKPISRSFTLEDYQLEVEIYKKALEFLNNNSDNFSDQEIIRLVQHAKILRFGHVFWREDTYDVNSPSFGLTQQFKDAEGAKLLHKAYGLIQVDQSARNKPTEQQLEIIIKNLDDKQFTIGLFKRPLSKDALVLSSHDLHLLCVVKDPLDSEYGFIMGMFTSAKDQGTVILSNTQEINDNPDEENKEQRFRASTKLVRIKLNEFHEHTNATTFAKGFNKDGANVHQTVVNAIKSNLPLLQSNNVEDPIVFTREVLIELAKSAFNQLINDQETQMKKIMHKLKSKDHESKEQYQSRLEAQKRNDFQKELEQRYKDSLSREDELLYDIVELLKKRAQAYKNKTNEANKLITDVSDTKKVEAKSMNDFNDTTNINNHE